jgi:hypothetical protein
MLEPISSFRAIDFFKKSPLLPFILLAAIWLVLVILVNPLGDFPLNDDWVYGLAVREILEKGNFRLPSPASANVFSQAYWGALFCLPFGFSFTALRFSTLVLGCVGILAVYALLLETGARREIAFFGALLIAIDPFYLGLSNTFMTDIPFTATSLLSIYFYIKGFKNDAIVLLILGLFFGFIALLIRQFGVILFIAFGVAYLFKKGFKIKNLFLGLSPLALAIFLQVSYQRWLLRTGRTPPVKDIRTMDFMEGLSRGSLQDIFRNIWIVLIYAGLLLFPFIIVFFTERLFVRLSRRQRNITSLALLGFTFVVTIVYFLRGKLMPLSTNIITYFGLGPLTLKDTFLLKTNLPEYSEIHRLFWGVATFIGVFGAAILLYYLGLAIAVTVRQALSVKNRQDYWLNALVLSAIVSYTGILGVMGLFDRYVLPLLPLLMITIVLVSPDFPRKEHWQGKRPAIALALASLALGAILSTAATHDYLAWNRARWEATGDLLAESISPRQIDGGYEFNGWYLNDIDYKPKKGKSYWWVHGDEYKIASGPMKRHEEIERYPYTKWLPPGQGNIFVLRKASDSVEGQR